MAKTKTSRVPPITAAQVRKNLADWPKRLEEIRQTEEDRRCLRGEFEPKKGVCRVCNGRVEANVRFPHTDRMGGPPLMAFVHHWSCTDCKVMYDGRPT